MQDATDKTPVPKDQQDQGGPVAEEAVTNPAAQSHEPQALLNPSAPGGQMPEQKLFDFEKKHKHQETVLKVHRLFLTAGSVASKDLLAIC